MATPTLLKLKFNGKTSYSKPRDWNQNSRTLDDGSKGRPFDLRLGPGQATLWELCRDQGDFAMLQATAESPLWHLQEPLGQRPIYVFHYLTISVFFKVLSKPILKFTLKDQKTRIAKKILKNNKKEDCHKQYYNLLNSWSNKIIYINTGTEKHPVFN